MLKYGSFRSTIKYAITPYTPNYSKKKKLLLLLLLLIFSPSIRMIEKNIIFDDKKVKKGFYKN